MRNLKLIITKYITSPYTFESDRMYEIHEISEHGALLRIVASHRVNEASEITAMVDEGVDLETIAAYMNL